MSRRVERQRGQRGDRNECEAVSTGHREEHRHHAGRDPCQLEARLELSERPTAVGVGGISLHDGLERQPSRRCREVHCTGQRDGGERTAEQCR
jgi:hypothetical protein